MLITQALVFGYMLRATARFVSGELRALQEYLFLIADRNSGRKFKLDGYTPLRGVDVTR